MKGTDLAEATQNYEPPHLLLYNILASLRICSKDWPKTACIAFIAFAYLVAAATQLDHPFKKSEFGPGTC